MLSFYNHYDVQSADPLDEWDSDPWAAEIRDGRMYARGVADNKGNIAARVAAVQAWKAVRGSLPVSVKFIIEGQEEISSPSLMDFALANRELCAADACIWEFGGCDIDGRPQIHLGLKGICYVELRASGARLDWHSSVATSVPNPALMPQTRTSTLMTFCSVSSTSARLWTGSQIDSGKKRQTPITVPIDCWQAVEQEDNSIGRQKDNSGCARLCARVSGISATVHAVRWRSGRGSSGWGSAAQSRRWL
ncbi:MAG: M20/M25/M40 family metallo-hydrolase, partial [Chloroflexia bacterium]|nr:M20/M25/M40 family metallo-hydrolase [Chloroflexia bacterium]